MSEVAEQAGKKSSGMKQMLLVGLVFCVLAIGFGLIKVFTPREVNIVPGFSRKAAVDFSVLNLQSNDLMKLSDKRGNVVLVKLIKTSDEVAQKEVLDMNVMRDQYRDKRFEQVAVFADGEEKTAAVKEFANDNKLMTAYGVGSPPTIKDDGSTPQTLLVDNQGRIALRIKGPVKDFNRIRELVDKLLAEEIR